MLITIDFETFYSTEYSLSRLRTEEYVLDPRFEAMMVTVAIDEGPIVAAVGDAEIRKLFKTIPWDQAAVLAQNTRFDASIAAWYYGVKPKLWLDTLSMARACTHTKLGRSSLKKLAEYFGLPAKGNTVAEMRGKRLSDLTPEELADYIDYCKHDTWLCREIAKRFLRVIPKSEIMLMDMTVRMFVEPVVHLDPLALAKHKDMLDREFAIMMAKVDSIDPQKYGGPKDTVQSIFSSTAKFKALLEDYGVDVPMKRSPATGKIIAAVAKNDREFKEMLQDDTLDPFVQVMLAARVGVKSTIEMSRTATLQSVAKQPWQRVGMAPHLLMGPLKYYAAHCVPGDTEVLTRSGWERLDKWSGGDIAQVYPDRRIEFLPAKQFVGPVVDRWIESTARYMPCDFTLGHTFPYLQHGSRRWQTMQAFGLLDRKSTFFPNAGYLTQGGSITPEQMRVLAMVQADGHWETDTAQGRALFIFVKKQRKIERARLLLAAAGVAYREGEYASHKDMVRFIVRWDDCPAWLTVERKFFGPWLLDSTPEARNALLDEVQHWDGWVQGGQIQYSTSDKVNADWLITVAHLANRGANMDAYERGEGRRTNYRVRLRQRNFAMVKVGQVNVVDRPQQAFCAETQTGFFLARRRGQIFVTGNTGRFGGDNKMNLQNLRRGSPLEGAIVAPPGYVIIHRDASQIEARMLAWLAGCEVILDAFRNKRDLYCEFASIVYGRQITKADKLERFVGKTCTLGLGYQTGWQKLRHTLFLGNGGISVNIDEPAARRIVQTYRSTYPEIPALWQSAEELLRALIEIGQPITHSNLTLTMRQARRITFEEAPKRFPVVEISTDTVWLPNGMPLNYPNIREEAQVDPNSHIVRAKRQKYYDGPYGPTHIYGGKTTENIDQALSRIVVMDVALAVKKETDYWPFLSTHDSLDYCVPEDHAEMWHEYLAEKFATVPAWATGLPLASEGGWGRTMAEAKKER